MGFGIRYATSSPYWQYYYFGKNIQGDVIALYRSDYKSSSQSYYPTLVATYSYDPWGTPTSIYDASGNAISQTAYHVAAYNPFRYRGYRYDGDTRLYYLQSRYYDPAIGRFINADKYAGTGQGYLGYNMFAYCNNNPISCRDSKGQFVEIVGAAVLGGALAGAAVAAGASIFNSYVNGDEITLKSVGTAALQGAVEGAVAGFAVLGPQEALICVGFNGLYSAATSISSGASVSETIISTASAIFGTALGAILPGAPDGDSFALQTTYYAINGFVVSGCVEGIATTARACVKIASGAYSRNNNYSMSNPKRNSAKGSLRRTRKSYRNYMGKKRVSGFVASLI